MLIGFWHQTFTRWAKLLKVKEKLEKLEKKSKKEGWHHGRNGGAGYHQNPELRVERARATRKARTQQKSEAVPEIAE